MRQLLLLIFLLPLGSGQSERGLPAQGRASIQGVVVRLGTSLPIGRASVTLTRKSGSQQSYTATTRDDGKFSFVNLEPAEYELKASRDGYMTMAYGQRALSGAGISITVQPAEEFKDAIITLLPAATIAGRIVDHAGEPLADVDVRALRYRYREGTRILTSVKTAKTNDLGEYRLFWLQPGRYVVSAQANEAPRTLLSGASPVAGPGIGNATLEANALGENERYIPTYFPNTRNAEDAAPLELQAGALYSGVDMIIQPVRTIRVRGVVVSATGQPVPEARVALTPWRVEETLLTKILSSSADGRFEFRGVVPGSYDITATYSYDQARLFSRLPLQIVADDIDNVSLVLTAGFTLSGRVGSPARAPENFDARRVRIMLRPRVAGLQTPRVTETAQLLNDGTFTLRQIPPGDYRVGVAGIPPGWYIQSVRLGSIDVLDQGLSLNASPREPLDIIISPGSASLDGVVLNSRREPAVNVTAVLVPEAGSRHRFDLYRVVSTDTAGRFHAGDIAPGTYKVFAWEDVETDAWQDPDFLRAYEDRGQAVRFSQGGTAAVELRLIESGAQ